MADTALPTTIPADATGQEVEAPPSPETPWTQPKADIRAEYVRGRIGFGAGISGYLTALPAWIDDLTRDFGADLYERMLFDSQVFACVHVLVLSVMSEGWQLHPATHGDEEVAAVKLKPPKKPIPPQPGQPSVPLAPPEPDPEEEEDPDVALAAEIRTFCKRQFTNLGSTNGQPVAFEPWLYEMISASLTGGHKIAEKTFDDGTGEDDGRLCLLLLKTKPRKATAFVVDQFMNLLGLLKAPAGMGVPAFVGAVGAENPGDIPDLVPREKFCVLTWMPKEGDPRGRSILRAAYDSWFRKQQTKGEELKFLAQCAAPSLIGTTAEGATASYGTDALGNVLPGQVTRSNPAGAASQTPEQQMVSVLEGIRGGSCGAVPFGAKVEWLVSGSDGKVFQASKDSQDREIAMAILCQTLATMEGEHQARAAAETHKGVLDTVVSFLRRWVESMVQRDLLYYLTLYNWGKDVADRLTPEFKLGGQTAPLTVADVAALTTSGYLDPSQYPVIDKKLGLPMRAEPEPMVAPPVPPAPPPGVQGQQPGQPGLNPPAPPPHPGEEPPSGPPQPAEKPPAAFSLSEADRTRMAEVTGGDVLAAKALWRRLERPKKRRKAGAAP